MDADGVRYHELLHRIERREAEETRQAKKAKEVANSADNRQMLQEYHKLIGRLADEPDHSNAPAALRRK